MLVAAMNPCPCGYHNHPEKSCSCHPNAIQRYLQRISGPLLDRIDMHIEVSPVKHQELKLVQESEQSGAIRQRVMEARNLQIERYAQSSQIHANAQMSRKDVAKFCQLDEAGNALLQLAMKKLGLSARAYDRILKVARTIADLDQEKHIMVKHLSEAIQYRNLDRSS
jgi:magnesium chelatase family protein